VQQSLARKTPGTVPPAQLTDDTSPRLGATLILQLPRSRRNLEAQMGAHVTLPEAYAVLPINADVMPQRREKSQVFLSISPQRRAFSPAWFHIAPLGNKVIKAVNGSQSRYVFLLKSIFYLKLEIEQ
jgi:hypothetical protein